MKDKNAFRLSQESVRVESLKLIHDYQNEVFGLYDLSNDISERNNLVDEVDPQLIEDMYEELKLIGPCHDRQGRFWIKKQKKTRSCAWFERKKTFHRCSKFQEGYLYCGSSCALRSSKQCKKIIDER